MEPVIKPLNERARRILLAAPTAPDPLGPDPKRRGGSRSRPRKQELAVIHRAWQRMTTKLCLVLRTFHHKEMCTKLMGKDAYLRVFRDIKHIKTERTQDEHPTVWRIIDEWTVEEPMKPSTTRPARVSAEQCTHPGGQMQRRGNKHKAWYTCLACNSRWVSRTVGSHIPLGEPTPNELVMFGKHKGKTFHWVTNNDPSWCKWVVMSAEQEIDCSEGLRRLARHHINLESQEADRQCRMDQSTRNKRSQPESSCPAAHPRSFRAASPGSPPSSPDTISSFNWSEVPTHPSTSGSEQEPQGPLFGRGKKSR